ncbi:MAG: RNA polymerase sigma factor [Pseudonocardiaceae bacterium]
MVELGRHEAFAEYVLPEIDVLYRVARALTGQPADAEDLVQDTLLRAFRFIDRFDGQHPRAWLLTILRNAEHSRHRRKHPQLLIDPEEAVKRIEADPDRTGHSPEKLLVDPVLDAVVERAFAALPDKYRRIVTLIDVEGLTYANAAAVLGVPVGTVTSRLHRARRRIRGQLAAEGVRPKRGGG